MEMSWQTSQTFYMTTLTTSQTLTNVSHSLLLQCVSYPLSYFIYCNFVGRDLLWRIRRTRIWFFFLPMRTKLRCHAKALITNSYMVVCLTRQFVRTACQALEYMKTNDLWVSGGGSGGGTLFLDIHNSVVVRYLLQSIFEPNDIVLEGTRKSDLCLSPVIYYTVRFLLPCFGNQLVAHFNSHFSEC